MGRKPIRSDMILYRYTCRVAIHVPRYNVVAAPTLQQRTPPMIPCHHAIHNRRRHHFFVTAYFGHNVFKSDSKSRQCIAAFHHEMCFGLYPLIAVRRFLTLLSQPENSAIARAEIQVHKNALSDDRTFNPYYVPCPYIVSLLGSAATTDLEEERFYASGTTLEAGMLNPRSLSSCWVKRE